MASIKSGIKPAYLFFFILSAVISHTLTAQNTVPLSSDLQRLSREQNNPASGSAALMSIARLHQLSGDYENALEAWMRAFNAAPAQNYRALFEAVRLLISMGEYDKADTELRKINSSSGDTLLEARFLWAELMAFSRGDLSLLTQMASDAAYLSRRSEIYYVLWRNSGNDSWKTRLLAEFPQSPEAKICSTQNNAFLVNEAVTTQWLMAGSAASRTTPAVNPVMSAPTVTAAPAASPSSGMLIQTGLFGVEANARAEADRLTRAGFRASLSTRQSNGNNLWVVLVDGGTDSNATLRNLKNAGWPDAFPVAR